MITEYLKDCEVAFVDADEMQVVKTMRERKHIMAEAADGYIVLPGGLGTYEEFFEILVGRVLAEHNKPIGVVNDHGYFDPLIAMIDHGVEEQFIRPAARDLIVVGDDPIDVLEELKAAERTPISVNDLIPPLADKHSS